MKTYFATILIVAIIAILSTCLSTEDSEWAYKTQPATLSETFKSFGSEAHSGKLGQPAAHWQLPDQLQDIASFAILDDDRVACINNSEGYLYIYNPELDILPAKIKFADTDEYKGIAVAKDMAYVLTKGGMVYEIGLLDQQHPVIRKYTSQLPKHQEATGLTYDKVNDRLLLSCLTTGMKQPQELAIYALSLTDRKLLQEPIFAIPLHTKMPLGDTIKKRVIPFIQSHPVSGELYVLNAGSPSMQVLDEAGKVTREISLDSSHFRNFSFNAKGEMYLATTENGATDIMKYEAGF